MDRPRYAKLICIALGVAAVPTSLAAQDSCGSGGVLIGTPKDAETGVLLGFTVVHLVSESGHPSLRKRADRSGRVVFCGPSGRYWVEASLADYTMSPRMVTLADGDTIYTTLVLSRPDSVIALAALEVSAKARDVGSAGFEGFTQRQESGFGAFILSDELQRRNPSRLTDVLQQTGVTVINNGRQVYIRRSSCAPQVYIDGARVTHLSRSGGYSTSSESSETPEDDPTYEAAAAINMVHPSAVRAIEVYRGPGDTPSEYLDSNARCGVILIWTWRGARR